MWLDDWVERRLTASLTFVRGVGPEEIAESLRLDWAARHTSLTPDPAVVDLEREPAWLGSHDGWFYVIESTIAAVSRPVEEIVGLSCDGDMIRMDFTETINVLSYSRGGREIIWIDLDVPNIRGGIEQDFFDAALVGVDQENQLAPAVAAELVSTMFEQEITPDMLRGQLLAVPYVRH